jgi:hypothetical protein
MIVRFVALVNQRAAAVQPHNKIPNSNIQVPGKLQLPKFKQEHAILLILNLDGSLEFGAWNLALQLRTAKRLQYFLCTRFITAMESFMVKMSILPA